MNSAAHPEPTMSSQGLLTAVLTGTATLGRLSAAEPEDAVAAIWVRASSAERADFDAQCLTALREFRAGLMKSTGRRFDLGLGRLQTTLAIVRRLKPTETVRDLHADYMWWNGFFSLFTVDEGLDLRREYWRILAQTQDVAPATIEPRRFMPLWLNICAESGHGGLYHESYLRVGLMGLRGLPLGKDFDANEDFALQGLGRWAATRLPSKPAFMREWRLLGGDFPRGPDFWPKRVERVVAGIEDELAERTRRVQKSFPAAAWWREDSGFDEVPRGPAIKGSGPLAPPPQERRREVIDRIGSPFTTLKPLIDRLIEGHRRYADATGDVFYLVRTACNVGMRLISSGAPAERRQRGEKAVGLAELALDHQPSNPFAWALYRDGLRNAGRLADAELVGWETIRRFPENEQWRNQLATLLAESLQRPAEAAALLTEAIATFPDDAFARTQLATILADDLGRNDEARAVLAKATTDGVADEVTGLLLTKLDRGRPRRREGRSTNAAVGQVGPATLQLPAAEARRMLFRRENGLATVEELGAFVDAYTPDPYLDYVGIRAGARSSPLDTAFVHAFDRAARDGSAAALRLLRDHGGGYERALVEITAAVIEDRVPANTGAGDGGIRRFDTVVGLFAGSRPPGKAAKIRLLRDIAASTLAIAA